ncbi:O-antigen/teichoic acid export membrane protein [Sinomonas sp. RB5]
MRRASKPSNRPSSSGLRIFTGAAWTYASQLATVIIQFAYAAVTSRAVSPEGFGQYAIGLTVVGLVSLLSSGGLGQSIARMQVIEAQRVKSLVTYALMLGCVGSMFLYLTAGLWATIWGSQSAVHPLELLAISSFISPLLGLANGLMTRLGKFRKLAVVTLVSNIGGMLFGALAVVTLHSSTSLVVSPITAQLLALIGCLLSTDRLLLGFGRLGHTKGDLSYSWRVIATSVLTYFSGNIVKFAMARAIAPATLGHWNRAEAITLVPLQQLQSAIISAVFPEFRHDVDNATRARTVWTDLFTIVAWFALPISACGAVVIPSLLPIIFGSQWHEAALLAAPLSLAGGIQILATLLASAIGALARFRWLWSTELILIVLQAITALSVFFFHEVWIASSALVLAYLTRHLWQLHLAGKEGYLALGKLFRQYLLAALFAMVMSSASGLEIWVISIAETPFTVALAVMIPTAFIGGCYLVRNLLPPVLLARKYGFRVP